MNKEKQLKTDQDVFERGILEAKKVEPLKSAASVMSRMWVLLRILEAQKVQGDVLEIGVKKGKTTVFLSNIMKDIISDRYLFTIDPFSEDGALKSLKSERFEIDSIYKTFQDHTKNLTNHTHYKISSEDINSILDKKLAMSFIDGEHTYTAVIRDFKNVFQLTSLNGIIAIDDYQNPAWPGVPKAYKQILEDYKDEIKVQSTTTKTSFLRKVKDVSRPSV